MNLTIKPLVSFYLGDQASQVDIHNYRNGCHKDGRLYGVRGDPPSISRPAALTVDSSKSCSQKALIKHYSEAHREKFSVSTHTLC